MFLKFMKNFFFISKRYLIVTPLFYSYGNAAEEIKWALARSNLLKKKLLIIPPLYWTQFLGYSICNRSLFQINSCDLDWEDKLIKYLLTILINIIFFCKRVLAIFVKSFLHYKLPENFFFPQFGRKYYWPSFPSNLGLNPYSEDPILTNINSYQSFNLSLPSKNRSLLQLPNMIKYTDKYVCLHLRESGFHKDFNRRKYRNATIENYIPAINFLLDNGIGVIRIGDESMKQSNINHPNYFECFKAPYKNHFNDLNIIKNCQFFIGMQSGPQDVAYLFNKPTLTLNMYSWIISLPLKNIDRGLFKRVYIANREVRMIDFPLLNQKFVDIKSELKDDDEIFFLENTPLEILQATKEFYLDYKTGFTRPPPECLIEKNLSYRRSVNLYLKLQLKNNIRCYDHHLNRSRLIYRSLADNGLIYDFDFMENRLISNP